MPERLWEEMGQALIDNMESLKVGDVANFRNFMGAVITDEAFNEQAGYIERARAARGVESLAVGHGGLFQGLVGAASPDPGRGRALRKYVRGYLRTGSEPTRLPRRRMGEDAAARGRHIAVRAHRAVFAHDRAAVHQQWTNSATRLGLYT